MHTMSLFDFSVGTGGKFILNRFRKGVHLICLTLLPRPKPHNIFGWSFKGIFAQNNDCEFCPSPFPLTFMPFMEGITSEGTRLQQPITLCNMDVSFVFRGVQNISALGPSTQVVDLLAGQLKNYFPFSDSF